MLVQVSAKARQAGRKQRCRLQTRDQASVQSRVQARVQANAAGKDKGGGGAAAEGAGKGVQPGELKKPGLPAGSGASRERTHKTRTRIKGRTHARTHVPPPYGKVIFLVYARFSGKTSPPSLVPGTGSRAGGL